MKVALQLDHLFDLNMSTDSSLFIAYGLQLRGHSVYFYHPSTLVMNHNGAITAELTPITVTYHHDAFHCSTSISTEVVDLSSFDIVLIRQDPPFDMNYISTCHILSFLPTTCLVLNNPSAIINQPEKISVLHFPDYIPPSLICLSLNTTSLSFIHHHKQVVAKPLYGHGGLDVILLDVAIEWQLQLSDLITRYGTVVLQKFLPQVNTHGDKRIFMLGGEIIGSFQRKPAVGEIRSNLAVGGTAFSTTLTTRELEICAQIKPWLYNNGLFFAGIDLLAEHLIEINVTSPTGLTTLKKLGHLDFLDVAIKLEAYKERHLT